MIDKVPQSLREVYEHSFEPEKLASAAEKSKRHYTQSLDRFDRFLGHPATVNDLNEETLIDLMQWLTEEGYRESSLAETRYALRAIWSFHSCPPALADSKQTGDRTATRETTLGEYLREVYAMRRQICDGSLYQYQVAVDALDRFAGEPIRLAELTAELVNRWIAHLSAGSLAPATVRNRRRHMITLWHAAHRDRLTDYRPDQVRNVSMPWVPPKAWSCKQVQQLLSVAESLDGHYPDDRWQSNERYRMRRPIFWGLAIRLAWDTGLRTCDLLELRPGWLSSDGTIELVQRKTRRWHMTRVNDETRERILASFPPQRETIIPWKLSGEYFRREFSEIVKLTGLRGTFKTLRKSSGTEVELLFPGCGAAHLGHVCPGDIARTHYFDPKLLAGTRPMPRPLRVSGLKGDVA